MRVGVGVRVRVGVRLCVGCAVRAAEVRVAAETVMWGEVRRGAAVGMVKGRVQNFYGQKNFSRVFQSPRRRN